MSFFLVAIIAGLFYASTQRRIRVLTAQRGDASASLDIGTELFAGRPLTPAVAAARRRLLDASDDPEIETVRRTALATWGIFAILVLPGLVLGSRLDVLIASAWEANPLAAAVPIFGLILAAWGALVAVESMVGPVRNTRRALLGAGALLGGVIAIAIASAIV